MALKDWFRSQKLAGSSSADSAIDPPEEASPDSAPMPAAGEAARAAAQSADSDSAPAETRHQERLDELCATVNAAYSFVATTTFLPDLASAYGKSFVAHVHPFAARSLSERQPAFKQLYDQVVNDQCRSVIGTGMSPVILDAGRGFDAWLKKNGVVADLASLADRQFFVCEGDAQDDRDGTPYHWMVLFYFELSS